MSNRRKPNARGYRSGYLRSPQWFARRDRWFADHQDAGRAVACAACRQDATSRQLELHHVRYDGVTKDGEKWVAGEEHDDLLPLHPLCHELLHRIIDTDPVLARHRARAAATAQALSRVRSRLTSGGA